MKPANVSNISQLASQKQRELATKSLHSAWRALIRYCAELQHGEIEILKIQDGLPVVAEVVRKKIKFTS